MVTIGANGQKISYGIKHYNVDTTIELANINPAKEIMGTTAFVLENSKYYMIDGSHKWVEIKPFGSSSGNSGGGGDIPDHVIYDGGVVV